MTSQSFYLTLMLACTSCATQRPASFKDQSVQELAPQICHWTGMRQASQVRSDSSVDLSADGTIRRYFIYGDQRDPRLTFMPENFDLSDVSLGEDTVRDSQTRAICIAAAEKLNQHLQLPCFGSPTIQRAGHNFVVSFLSMPENKLQNAAYLDPYVSFLVTPRGTVFGVFLGA